MDDFRLEMHMSQQVGLHTTDLHTLINPQSGQSYVLAGKVTLSLH